MSTTEKRGAYAHATEVLRPTRLATAFGSLTIQLVTLVFLVGLVLWTVLFTVIGPLHDPLHALRHVLYLIPCH